MISQVVFPLISQLLCTTQPIQVTDPSLVWIWIVDTIVMIIFYYFSFDKSSREINSLDIN
jgi:hypothetical protein